MDLPLALYPADDTLRTGVKAALASAIRRGLGEMKEVRIVGLSGLYLPWSLLRVYCKPDTLGA